MFSRISDIQDIKDIIIFRIDKLPIVHVFEINKTYRFQD